MAARELPPDFLHLITTGHLMAREREALGFQQMMCALCQERPLDLMWLHEPVQFQKRQTKKTAVIPPGVSGEDVIEICPCCSFAECPHRQGP